jgi:tetratricopeptide (TPR) repeat protein
MSSFSSWVNEAGRHLMKGDFEGALRIYESMAEAFPDRLGECQGHIGAAHHAMGRHQTAIEFYEKALATGADDEDMVRENLKEARRDLAKRK